MALLIPERKHRQSESFYYFSARYPTAEKHLVKLSVESLESCFEVVNESALSIAILPVTYGYPTATRHIVALPYLSFSRSVENSVAPTEFAEVQRGLPSV